MHRNNPTEEQIRTQFVTSLMEYFKIEEDINLRAHIADLVRNIDRSQYREFFRRLSSRDMPFKNGFEKIARIAEEFSDESLTPIEQEATKRCDRLYHLMYDLRREITLARDGEKSALERFENVRFGSIRNAGSDTPLLDETDIAVVKKVGKKWIYDYVSLDRGLFEARLIHEYRNAIVERERNKNSLIAAPLRAKLLSDFNE